MSLEMLIHLQNSSDLAPSDFQLFGPLKDSLSGIKFTNNDAVQPAFVHIFLTLLTKVSMLQASHDVLSARNVKVKSSETVVRKNVIVVFVFIVALNITQVVEITECSSYIKSTLTAVTDV